MACWRMNVLPIFTLGPITKYNLRGKISRTKMVQAAEAAHRTYYNKRERALGAVDDKENVKKDETETS